MLRNLCRQKCGGTGDRRLTKIAYGFALIATMAVMVLVVMAIIAMLSLAALESKSGRHDTAEATARANAKLSLMLAIGKLQLNAGSDTRVTARADILNKTYPPILGVWKSWEGQNHETHGRFAGRPISPGNYTTAKEHRFIGWLTSGNSQTLPQTSLESGKVTLVGSGSLEDLPQNKKLQIHLTPTPIEPVREKGSLAWWIGGENQKARLPKSYTPENDNAAGWAVHAQSHAVADPGAFHLDRLLNSPSLSDKAITLAQADSITTITGSFISKKFFHDLSTVSVGLLTNVATGGWRKDLSLLSENWAAQPKTNLPLFQLTLDHATQASIPAPNNPVSPRSMLYPWATYRGGNNIPIYQHGPVSSWENLINFATHYKRVKASSSGQISAPTHSVHIGTRTENFSFLHRVRVLPLVARMQWLFSHTARPAAGNRPDQFEPLLLLTPVVTLWNPYNVEITTPPVLRFIVPKALPTALRYSINGRQNPSYNAVMSGNTNQPSLGGNRQLFQINQPTTLKPGETRLYSPRSTSPVANGSWVILRPGYRNGGGYYYSVRGPNGENLVLPGSTIISADAKFDTEYLDGARGVGIYLDVGIPHQRHLVYRMVYAPEVANEVYPPLQNLAGATLSQCLTNPQPFLSTIFGARTASNTHLASKGFVQSSPFVNYTALGGKDVVERTIRRHYGGTDHPVNSPFDYSFIKHAPGGDSMLPNASDTTGRGYIVTGFSKADGLSRCVIAELPIRPLASLAELTHWDMRYENPIPPYAINLIGNSDASPLLPANAVVNSRDKGLTENLQYDDSYCANHLLFDDWFFSSIAPDPISSGQSGRDLNNTYKDFISGARPLANCAYKPVSQSRPSSNISADQIYDQHIAKVDSWRTIASRLEVEGMFNVNSTSVTAWRALLGHARNQRIPYIEVSDHDWQIQLSEKTNHALSRFSIAGDSMTGTAGSSGDFPEATEFAGYRVVDDSFLDALAEEVVAQIRARGPFLSLAEFVNRQLSSGELALAGTLQAALNEMAKKSEMNPFEKLQTISSQSVAVPVRAEQAEYQFPEAAEGHSSYGLPGWTRQADILRPLAPILSARDDTFVIRAYGDARDKNGNVLATAICEAVVRRTRGFVDSREAADLVTRPSIPANQNFGRRFIVVSFRWLSQNEV